MNSVEIQEPKIDVARSKEIAAKVDAQLKACYNNASDGLMHLGKNAMYTEGYTYIPSLGICFEHAWLLEPSDDTDDAQFKIVDPTLVLLHEEEAPDVLFFAGRKYSKQDTINLGWDMVPLPFFYQYGHGGFRDEEHRAAANAAHQFAYGINLVDEPQEEPI